jgi:sugar phosphate isomerase/epimerase
MKLGANSVLFGGYDLDTAFKQIAMAGYEGIELSAIDGTSQHLVPERWQELGPQIRQLSQTYGLELLAIERASQDLEKMEMTFQAAVELRIPIVACGPVGKMEDEASWQQNIDSLGRLAERAERFGVTLCVKAHVGGSIYNTSTFLRAMEAIPTKALGINMDPSHIYRAGEDPVEALRAVIAWVKHVHIRDCKGRQPSPGKPEDQTNGRGDIDLLGFFRVLAENKYPGALDLEIIGAHDYSLVQCSVIAAEARGHMQACRQACSQ